MSTKSHHYIHIPPDILADHYRCPTTVTLQLGHTGPGHRHSGQCRSPRETLDIPDFWKTSSKLKTSPSLWGHRKKVMIIPGHGRIMEGDEADGDSDTLDVIDSVARANEMCDVLDNLPELRASPCHIHYRQQDYKLYQQVQRSDARNDLLYSTNSHGGAYPANNSLGPQKGLNYLSPRDRQMERKIQQERDATFQRDLLAGKAKTYARPVLPKEMTPQDYVSTWLVHGSEPKPKGGSHFPHIVHSAQTPGRRDAPTNKKLPEKSGIKSAEHLHLQTKKRVRCSEFHFGGE